MALGKDNLGGLKQILTVATEDVAEVPGRDLDGRTISSAVTLSSGSWTDLTDFIALYGMELKETKVEDNGDDSWRVEIITNIPASEADTFVTYFEGPAFRKPVIVDATDANGNRRLFGNVKEPMRIGISLVTGSKPGNASGETFVFRGTFSKRSPIYNP